MTEAVLVVNVGSSSIKMAAYPQTGQATPIWRGEIGRIGRDPVYQSQPARAAPTAPPTGIAGAHEPLIRWLLERIRREQPTLAITAAGHRVVHGGTHFDTPVMVTAAVIEQLQRLNALAPSHQPYNLAGIHAVAEAWPAIPQIACFDTAFHRSQPRLAQLFALPRRLLDEGVVRYGFHGLSYEYIAGVLPDYLGERADGRVIVGHLGHGASLCALRGRRSVATSMGFTALDGLVMGRRCGNLDPGVVLHLLRDRGMSVAEVDQLLSSESGLLGVSGISDDIRDLVASDSPNAREAIDLFVYRAITLIGALVAQLGGLDALVFTGGIGEHATGVRARIMAGLEWLGARLDPVANDDGAARISTADSAVTALVIATDEEQVIARHTRTLTVAGSSSPEVS